eukprot:TRINITY_DN680_c0_g1_i7.p1 TRINITY_DN680_c0_g1~~TRINITY_DN680_c0_g1_i7.p1  ORF type:complete len:170 (-),score=24.14 TRINITY_DN680_c0_g1_i7:80-589(-)
MFMVPEKVLRSYFDKYDGDGSGHLSFREAKKLVYDMGYYIDDDAARLFFAAVDTSHDGKLSWDEFRKAYAKKAETVQQMKVIETDEGRQAVEYFRYFDKDSSGVLDKEEFRALWQDLEKYVSQRSIPPNPFTRYNLNKGKSFNQALGVLDATGDGKIQFNEFMSFMGYS